MQSFIECLKTEIIPAEIVQEFQETGTVFYDGMPSSEELVLFGH